MSYSRGSGREVDRCGCSTIDELLAAFASQIRIEILCKLADAHQSVSELAESLDLDVSSVSHHLGLLRERGFVTAKRVQRMRVYRLADGLGVAVRSSSYVINGQSDDGARLDLVAPMHRTQQVPHMTRER